MRLIFGIFLVLYVFALLQISFLVHFSPKGFVPHLIILAVVFLSIFERRETVVSQGAALFGGFLVDIFSGGIIGLWSTILFLTSLLIKIVLEDYVRLPIPKKF